MARLSYRSRRYRPRSLKRYRLKKSSLSKIKKDVMKCNFPTKIKFMGLTERKVMFLTCERNLQLEATAGNPACKSIYLNPMNADNIGSITKREILEQQQVKISNWDKMCILGIYIKLQPIRNQFDGTANSSASITQIQCTYSSNNVDDDGFTISQYDAKCKDYKQVFTFNSNEAFTIYVPAPTTMEDISPCVHKSKTWWAIANMLKEDDAEFQLGEEDEDEDVEYGSKVAVGSGNKVRAGRLMFYTKGKATYNVTINYKVALKG